METFDVHTRYVGAYTWPQPALPHRLLRGNNKHRLPTNIEDETDLDAQCSGSIIAFVAHVSLVPLESNRQASSRRWTWQA